jgi:predicted nucleic acid-binding protein
MIGRRPRPWNARCAQKGVTIPRNDLFVASVGICTGLTVACRDAHFDIVGRAIGNPLKVEQI